jgi:hypothetical protein
MDLLPEPIGIAISYAEAPHDHARDLLLALAQPHYTLACLHCSNEF